MIYTELEDVYAALIAAVHVDPARRVPQEWRDTLAGGVYKGKGKPIDGITSYRWLCFTSGLAKLYEAFLLYRAEPMWLRDYATAGARHARRVRLPEAFFPPGERGLFSTVRSKTLV